MVDKTWCKSGGKWVCGTPFSPYLSVLSLNHLGSGRYQRNSLGGTDTLAVEADPKVTPLF